MLTTNLFSELESYIQLSIQVPLWMANSHLELNMSEFLILPLQCNSTHFSGQKPSDHSWLSSDSHIYFCFINKSISLSFRTFRISLLPTRAVATLVQGTVISCLDYCNSFLAGLPAFTFALFQSTLNRAVRLILLKCKLNHIIALFEALQNSLPHPLKPRHDLQDPPWSDSPYLSSSPTIALLLISSMHAVLLALPLLL